MRPTRTLPSDYRRWGSVDLSKGRRSFLLFLGGIALIFPFGWLLMAFVRLARPELSAGEFRVEGLGAVLGVLFVIAMAVAVEALLHEAIHGLFFWLFTRHRPVFGLRGLYAYAAAPDWYLPRGQYLLVGVAPMLLITVAGLLLIVIAPPVVIPLLMLAVLFNAAGSLGDLLIVAWLITRRGTSFLQDTGDAITIHRPS